tara:strand:+ start:37 stop:138 length:102 start_codon:yes stop_codon:yes gene_type:complete
MIGDTMINVNGFYEYLFNAFDNYISGFSGGNFY